MDNVRVKTLPSPARFLELQGIKEVEDVQKITEMTLLGQHAEARTLLKEKYNKFEQEAEFIIKTYSEALFKYIMLSVVY